MFVQITAMLCHFFVKNANEILQDSQIVKTRKRRLLNALQLVVAQNSTKETTLCIVLFLESYIHTLIYTHARDSLMALFPGLPG